MFLDEVLEGSLDIKGKENIIKLLRDKATEFGSMFVISHDFEITSRFENIIKVQKENGVSRII